jgi:3-phosphoglycerate kinase
MRSIYNLKQAKKGETAVIRVGLDIEKGDMRNSLRLERSLETLRFLLKKGYQLVLISHQGRPHAGKQGKSELQEFSLKKFAEIFSDKLGMKVMFVPHMPVRRMSAYMRVHPARVHLLENIRFFEGEKKDDTKFARELAELGTLYVNDAFSNSHRKHASMHALAKQLPAYAGLALEKEIHMLSAVRMAKKKPFVLVVGGAKISDKLPLMLALRKKADYVLAGGGVANTIFSAHGIPVGKSLHEEGIRLPDMQNVFLPVDLRMEDGKILDIGPETAELFVNIVRKAKFVIWSGPVGDTDRAEYRLGSKKILDALCASGAVAVIGGGETTSFVRKQCRALPSRIFLSTGGGAMLEYLSGKKLPGLEALG